MKRTVLMVISILAALCVLLLVPLPEHHGDRWMVYLQDFAHFVLFALAVFLLVFLPGGTCALSLRRAVLIVAAALGIGLLAEFVQPFVGRTAGARDVLLGVTGGVAAVCVCAALSKRAWIMRVSCGSIALALAFAAVLPLVLIRCDRQAARRAFPLLASFESRAEIGRWSVNGCRVSRTRERATHGNWTLKIEVEKPDNYPGIFLTDSVLDLSHMRRLCFDAHVPGPTPLKIWLRIDDRMDPVYTERFQDFRTLFPGTNTLCVERAIAESTPSGRSLDLGRIHSLGLFFDQAKPGDILYIDNVRVLSK